MSNFYDLLKRFFHDPPDKVLDIRTHESRAKTYAELFNVPWTKDIEYSDHISSAMERSLLPEGMMEDLSEIIHPLSGRRIYISFNHNIIKEIEKILKNVSEKIKDYDDKKKFFYLWRNLQEEIIKNIKDQNFAKYIPVLPADTRIPDHSIWEHLKITCAINTFERMQNNCLFLLTIGPVQSFILQARKTQDLYSGSFILSYLTFIGIKEIINEHGPVSIIYPELHSQPLMDYYLEKEIRIEVVSSFSSLIEYPTLPNRFIAILPFSSSEEIEKIGERVSNAVKEEWKKICETVLNKFNIPIDENVKRQINDFPYIYWTAIPWKIKDRDIKIDDFSFYIENEEIERWREIFEFAKEKGEYKPNIGLLYELLYTSLEKSMGIRKKIRNFKPFEEESEVKDKNKDLRKCNICGERNALIGRKEGDEHKRVLFPVIEEIKFLRKGERLCVICFVKRALEFYLREKFERDFESFYFPSVAEVAVSDCKERAISELKKEYEEYIKEFKKITQREFPASSPLPKIKGKLGDNNLEGSWFFEENLRKEIFEKHFNEKIDEEEINSLREKLKKLTDKLTPSPYYAVIKLDGDNMGRWLAGELLPDIEHAYHSSVWKELPPDFKEKLKELTKRKFLTPAIHASISTALKNYSLEFVREILEEKYLGKVIYTGGDDILAFVNLKDLFDVLIELRKTFSGIKDSNENNTGFIEKRGKYILTMGPKATISAGIVITHYKVPLRSVLIEAENILKKAKNDKDSFGILLWKHSGERKIAISKWFTDFEGKRRFVLELLKNITDWMNKERKDFYFSSKFIYNLRENMNKLTENGELKVESNVFNTILKREISRSYNGEKHLKKRVIGEMFKTVEHLFKVLNLNLDYLLNILESCAFLLKEKKDVD